jgi:hypothetical protein
MREARARFDAILREHKIHEYDYHHGKVKCARLDEAWHELIDALAVAPDGADGWKPAIRRF